MYQYDGFHQVTIGQQWLIKNCQRFDYKSIDTIFDTGLLMVKYVLYPHTHHTDKWNWISSPQELRSVENRGSREGKPSNVSSAPCCARTAANFACKKKTRQSPRIGWKFACSTKNTRYHWIFSTHIPNILELYFNLGWNSHDLHIAIMECHELEFEESIFSIQNSPWGYNDPGHRKIKPKTSWMIVFMDVVFLFIIYTPSVYGKWSSSFSLRPILSLSTWDSDVRSIGI